MSVMSKAGRADMDAVQIRVVCGKTEGWRTQREGRGKEGKNGEGRKRKEREGKGRGVKERGVQGRGQNEREGEGSAEKLEGLLRG